MTNTTRPAQVMDAASIERMAARIIRDELQLRWTVRVNSGLRTLQGRCHYDQRVIELNPHIESVTDIERTILHEVAHAQVHEVELLDRRFRPSQIRARAQHTRTQHHGAAWKAAYAALLTKYGYAAEKIDQYA